MKLPYWHAKLDKAAQDHRLITRCPVLDQPDSRLPAVGFAPCQPEALRNHAEKKAREFDLKIDKVSLDLYSLARLIRSEWGAASVEMKVSAAECVRNQAKRLGSSIAKLLLQNAHGENLYGRITQGRAYDTSLDPTAGDLKIADFVLSGTSGDFARGGTNYISLAHLRAHPKPLQAVADWMERNTWIGPLAGVAVPQMLIFWPTPPHTEEQKSLNQQALLEIQIPSGLGDVTDTELHPRWDWAKVVGAAAGSGLLLFGVGVALSETMGRPWKDWKEH